MLESLACVGPDGKASPVVMSGAGMNVHAKEVHAKAADVLRAHFALLDDGDAASASATAAAQSAAGGAPPAARTAAGETLRPGRSAPGGTGVAKYAGKEAATGVNGGALLPPPPPPPQGSCSASAAGRPASRNSKRASQWDLADPSPQGERTAVYTADPADGRAPLADLPMALRDSAGDISISSDEEQIISQLEALGAAMGISMQVRRDLCYAAAPGVHAASINALGAVLLRAPRISRATRGSSRSAAPLPLSCAPSSLPPSLPRRRMPLEVLSQSSPRAAAASLSTPTAAGV